MPANKMHSRAPGDDKAMVSARNRFLSAEYYAPLQRLLGELCLSVTPQNPTVLDSGCGEGYYTKGIFDALTGGGKVPSVAGIDISKHAVRLAAKRLPSCEFAVASAYHLPVKAGTVDLLLNCFSPLCQGEFNRVLKKGGSFIYVVPAPRHLWELKCAVYDSPYENKRMVAEYEGFTLKGSKTVSHRAFVPDSSTISDLFTMTPYLWKTPKSGLERLGQLKSMEIEIAFDVYVYEKNGNSRSASF